MWEVSFSTRRRPWSSFRFPDLDPPFSSRRRADPVVLASPPSRADCPLSWGCPKIAPPSRSPAESTPRSGLPCTEVQGFSERSERFCPRALARPAHVPTSPFLRPRRFFPRQAAGVLHPAPIVGFGSFHQASALASASFPAPRSCPPKPCSPMRATPPAHAVVAAVRHRVAVADRAFTEPLAPSLLVVCTTGTSRLCSLTGAVPPCAVSSADGPLLPWACRSPPPRCRGERIE